MPELIQALVTRVQPYAETTLLLRLLTREAGVIRVLARGARGSRISAPGAHELFAWIEGQWSHRGGDSLGQLSKPELREAWPWLRSDLPRLGYAGLGLEVITILATSAPHEPWYFDEAVRFLTLLEHARGPGTLACALLLRVLHHAGFPPRLAQDLAGAAPWPTRLTYDFVSHRFAPLQPTDSSRAMRLPADLVRRLAEHGFFDQAPPLEQEWTLPAREGPIVLRWLVRVWEDHLQTRFDSMDFIETMILKPRR